jgi:hypothetical protein
MRKSDFRLVAGDLSCPAATLNQRPDRVGEVCLPARVAILGMHLLRSGVRLFNAPILMEHGDRGGNCTDHR